jgi:hypothetical protein
MRIDIIGKGDVSIRDDLLRSIGDSADLGGVTWWLECSRIMSESSDVQFTVRS